ncbi:MAG TPA: DUF6455 family protein [Burkholderiales bacterium]|nr:DUF6455 family protein [Burkholderiales bacterium]
MHFTLFIFALLLLGLAFAAWSGFRRLAEDEPLRLPLVARRLGVPFAAPMSEADAREAALATRRCLACNSKPLCDEWLREPKSGSLNFCPNAAYLRRLQRDTRPIR